MKRFHSAMAAFFLPLLVTFDSICRASSIKYNISDQVDQLIEIVHESTKGFRISGLEVNLSPSNFDYFVPVAVNVKCGDGHLYLEGMSRIRPDQIYMEAVSMNESRINIMFNVEEMTFKYNLCWMTVVVPWPIWLRGKLINSNYHVSGQIYYNPKCHVVVDKADLLSYDKMSLNIFKWLPGSLEDWFMDRITRKSEEEILKTVSQSMHYAVDQLTATYNPCVIFPAMGRMTPIRYDDEDDKGESGEMNSQATLETSEVPGHDRGNVQMGSNSIGEQNQHNRETSEEL